MRSASEFGERLRSAFRTDVPFSQILTDARLHEIVAVLDPMSPEEFANRPIGQKLLLFSKLRSLLNQDRDDLHTATAHVLASLTRLARLESVEQYEPIIGAALEWGLDRTIHPRWRGHSDIRDAMMDTCRSATQPIHGVIAKAYAEFVAAKDMNEIEIWYLVALRELATALLANPICGDGDASSLAAILDSINDALTERV